MDGGGEPITGGGLAGTGSRHRTGKSEYSTAGVP